MLRRPMRSRVHRAGGAQGAGIGCDVMDPEREVAKGGVEPPT